MKCEHIFGATSPKKVVPRQTGINEEYFYTADEKNDYILNIFTIENPTENWFVVGITFWGEVAPKMSSHFTSFEYFFIRFFAKCQKL